MYQVIDLGHDNKANLWIQENPGVYPDLVTYPSIDVIEKDIQLNLRQKLSNTKEVTIEILLSVGPRICYGLLGVDFIPENWKIINTNTHINGI